MLDPKRLGLSAGILWGVSLFIMTWAGLYLGYGTVFLDLMVNLYPGYTVTPVGSFVGLVYGFIDGFIGLFIFGWLYNWLDSRF